MTFSKLLFYLEDNRDVDTKEYWDDINLLRSFKGGIEREVPGSTVSY